ncbi:Ulp1 protease [Gracilaria domingensis]|nr:Ulp1 protease [Gracilaria domingensis]
MFIWRTPLDLAQPRAFPLTQKRVAFTMMEARWSEVNSLNARRVRRLLEMAVAQCQGKFKASWSPEFRPVWWVEEQDINLPDGTSCKSLPFISRGKLKWDTMHVRVTLYMYLKWCDERNETNDTDPRYVRDLDQDWLLDLTVHERKKLENISASSTEIQVGAGLTLKEEHLLNLLNDKYVGDDVLNSFMYILNERNCKRAGSLVGRGLQESQSEWKKVLFADQRHSRVFCFNTFLFPKLEQGDYECEMGSAWTIEGHGAVLEMDLLLIPVFLKAKEHWVLVVASLPNRCLVYLDPLHQADLTRAVPHIKRYLKTCIQRKYDVQGPTTLDPEKWECAVCPNFTPRQNDSTSCGVMVMYMAECLERGELPESAEVNTTVLRERVALFLLSHGQG